MKFLDVLNLVGEKPLFTTEQLGIVGTRGMLIYKQLSRWTASGRICQLRRGLYALNPPYRKIVPHPFYIANLLVEGSYVSLESALHYHGFISSKSSLIQSVTSSRPGGWHTELGSFVYRHLKSDFFTGYTTAEVGEDQRITIAEPEKALVDLLYLTPSSDHPYYINSLQLKNLSRLKQERLVHFANIASSHKVRRAAALVINLTKQDILYKLTKE